MASGGAGVGLGAWKGTPNRPDGQLGDFEVEDTLAWVFSGPVIPDRLPRPDTAGLGIDLGFRYDAHAHHFASANAADEATAATRWVDMETVVDASVLMGSIDGFADTGDKLKSSDSVNDAMFTVAATLPDFFAPFCHIVPAEHKDPAAAAEVTRCVGLGARGVGELYVHAHGEDTDSDDETEAFYDIFRTAAAEGVPVAVHWDIGNTEDSGSTSDYVQRDPADNFSQLTALLDMLSAEGNLPDIILCHCGAGPGGRDDEIAVDLETRLAELLTYSNVYFDIAGMQLPADGSGVREGVERLGDSSSGITALGQMIRDLIQDWPTRFLFGTDADDREDVDTADSFGVPSYIASVEGYPEFLDLPDSSGASLTKFNVARVMGRNLRRLIGVP